MMFIKYSIWRIFMVLLFFINIIVTNGIYRENLALRHPCNTINKRLISYITWTEKLASSQYKVQKDACGQIGIGPACCTHEIINSYATSLTNEFKKILDVELNTLTTLLSKSKQQIDAWSKEYITELHRLTISSLETLFGIKEYRLNIDQSLSTLFNTLSNSQSSVDDVSKSTMNLFNHLIISLYRRFIINNDQIVLDDNFQKCIVNKAFDMDALPKQRELLYILTSTSSLIQIFYTMLIYIDADIQRLKTTVTSNSKQCIQRYAREALCPLCIHTSSSFNQINNNDNVNEILCKNDCRYIIKTCVNQTNDPYMEFALIAKNYSDIIKEIEKAAIELKLVEHLAKLHIYLYDMVVNATNNRYLYMEFQAACPNKNMKSFSPILSLPPTMTERRELVFQWNRSLHFLLKRTQSSMNNLDTKFTRKLTTGICSNSIYASKSDRCTRIDKQTTNVIQWPLPSISELTLNTNNVELTRNQLDELKKKLKPIRQIITSLQPKKKYSLIQYIPDFESYNDDISIIDYDAEISASLETYDTDNQGSLSERLYNEIDGQTTRLSIIATRIYIQEKKFNNGELLTYNLSLYLIIFIIYRI
ncbi:unnamed protein product [Rotaria sp. Silwood1]|nr:unnamed protein product [Rotaria sp. Silwood1]